MKRRKLLQIGALATVVPAIPACGSEHTTHIDTRLPVSNFGPKSTAEDVTAGLNLDGKLALVTGCTSGLGYETMRVLALRGVHVIGTGRTLDKAREACGRVAGRTTPVALDLADFQSVVECAATVTALELPLDMLICNAGINTFGELELINGIESMFVVNFLGHFLLVNRLLPLVRAADKGRVVHVGSRSGYRSAPAEGVDFDNLRGEKLFDAGKAYGRSKLANALFSLELARRLRGSDTTSNVVHPGLVQTNIGRTAPKLLGWAFELFGGLIAKSPAEGAATQVYVATSPALQGVSGAYFEDCNPVTIEGPNHVFDAAMASRLWDTAVAMTGEHLI